MNVLRELPDTAAASAPDEIEARTGPRPGDRPEPAETGDRPEPARHLYLTGRPRLKDFISYVRTHARHADNDGTLTDEWQVAADEVQKLGQAEAGVADNPPMGKIGPEYEPLLIELLKDPLIRDGFNTVPTDVAFVDLDRLVVWQKNIDLAFVDRLEQKLTPAPVEEDIFRVCLLHDRLEPLVKWSQPRRNQFVFTSASNDLRFLGAMKIGPDHLQDCPPPGDLVGVAGVAVGFGRNFLNAIYTENRLILNNGSHRAYTLRKMGYTRVPCIIQHVASRDVLDVVGSSEVRRDPDLFLKHPRPPMLRDYFNPAVHKVMPVHRRLRQITVKFEIDETYVPGL